MRPIKTYHEFIKESTVNERKKYDYPSFQSNKGIHYQDMLISSGYWTYMGKERYGKGQYMNINNRQTYGFSPDDIEYFKKHLKDIEVMESALYEATVEMDALSPDDKDFLKFLKKNKVKIINKIMVGPGGGAPVITMQGKKEDLKKVLADPELGWDDPDLAEYIKESINEGIKATIKKLFKAAKKKLGLTKMVEPSDEIFLYARDYVDQEYGDGHTISGIGVDAIQDIIYGSTMDVDTGDEEDWEIEIPKHLQESVNEAVKLSLDVEEPFSDKDEKKAAAKYKWVPKASPITISKVEGEITEDETDIMIQFSNGDEIYYRWDASKKSAEIVTYNDDSYKVDEDVLDRVFGSTSTVVGDVALVYSEFKDGLNPSLFIKY